MWIGAPVLLRLCSVGEKEDSNIDAPRVRRTLLARGHLGSNRAGVAYCYRTICPPQFHATLVMDHHDNMSITGLGTIGRAVATSMSPATSSPPMRPSMTRGTTTPQRACRRRAYHSASVCKCHSASTIEWLTCGPKVGGTHTAVTQW